MTHSQLEDNITSKITEVAEKNIKQLTELLKTKLEVKPFKIEQSLLDEKFGYHTNDIRKSKVEEHKKLFDDLQNITTPVVYIFSITNSNTNATEIVKAISDYSKKDNSKAVPAIKQSFSRESNILYVGKSLKDFWGRVIQHLGYYKVTGTQGLQLFYWATPLNLELSLLVIEFPKDAIDLVPVFEKKLAEQLNPILGKFK